MTALRGHAMSRIPDWLWVACRPSFWVSNYPTSDALSVFINDALDKGCKPERVSSHTHRLNGLFLWTVNYPYAYGSPAEPRIGALPNHRTRERLWRAGAQQAQAQGKRIEELVAMRIAELP